MQNNKFNCILVCYLEETKITLFFIKTMSEIFEFLNKWLSFDPLSTTGQYLLVGFCFVVVIGIRIIMTKKAIKNKLFLFSDPMNLAQEVIEYNKKKKVDDKI